MKKLKAIAVAAAAALALTGCSVEALAGPDNRDIVEKMADEDILTLGMDVAMIEEIGYGMCESRDKGIPHRMILSVGSDQLGSYWSRRDLDVALNLWYAEYCPEHVMEKA